VWLLEKMLMLSLGGIEPKAILGSLMRAEARVARRLFRGKAKENRMTFSF
jgi:hypothetical protein